MDSEIGIRDGYERRETCANKSRLKEIQEDGTEYEHRATPLLPPEYHLKTRLLLSINCQIRGLGHTVM